MQNDNIVETIENFIEKDDRYPLRAYFFILEALEYTLSRLPRRRHLTGQELCEGIREYGTARFGLLVAFVFECWGISCTRDFGELVFNLIEMELLSKTSRDTIEDFEQVYDFRDAFTCIEKPLEPDIRSGLSFNGTVSLEGRTPVKDDAKDKGR
jgi:uncharacterized repeat protein (TIGR04138 family)